MFSALPKRPIEPVKSRKASSIEKTSTSGVNCIIIFMISDDVWVYLRLSPTTKKIWGHFCLASQVVIPVLTPKARASYEEVVMIVRLAEPITAMGFPRSSGLLCCSTEAKKRPYLREL